MASLTIRDWATLFPLLCAGLLGRLFALQRPLWGDEVITLNQLHQYGTLELFTEIVRTQPHFPLYYVLADVVILVWDTPQAVRGVSLIASLATVVVIYIEVRDIYDSRTGAYASGIIALSPYFIWWGINARMYSLLGLCTAVAMTGAWRVRTSGGTVARRRTTAATVLAALLHPYGLFVAGAVGIVTLPSVDVTELHPRARYVASIGIPIAASTTIIVAKATAVIPSRLVHIHNPPPLGKILDSSVKWLIGYTNYRAGMYLVAAFLVYLGIERLRVRDVSERTLWLGLWVLLPVVAAAVLSYTVTPIYSSRYLIPAAVGFAVAVAASLRSLPGIAEEGYAAGLGLLLIVEWQHVGLAFL